MGALNAVITKESEPLGLGIDSHASCFCRLVVPCLYRVRGISARTGKHAGTLG